MIGIQAQKRKTSFTLSFQPQQQPQLTHPQQAYISTTNNDNHIYGNFYEQQPQQSSSNTTISPAIPQQQQRKRARTASASRATRAGSISAGATSAVVVGAGGTRKFSAGNAGVVVVNPSKRSGANPATTRNRLGSAGQYQSAGRGGEAGRSDARARSGRLSASGSGGVGGQLIKGDTTTTTTTTNNVASEGADSAWIFGLITNIEQLLSTLTSSNNSGNVAAAPAVAMSKLTSGGSGASTPHSSTCGSSPANSCVSSPASAAAAASLISNSPSTQQQGTAASLAGASPANAAIAATSSQQRGQMSRQIKFHEYKGPPAIKRQQQQQQQQQQQMQQQINKQQQQAVSNKSSHSTSVEDTLTHQQQQSQINLTRLNAGALSASASNNKMTDEEAGCLAIEQQQPSAHATLVATLKHDQLSTAMCSYRQHQATPVRYEPAMLHRPHHVHHHPHNQQHLIVLRHPTLQSQLPPQQQQQNHCGLQHFHTQPFHEAPQQQQRQQDLRTSNTAVVLAAHNAESLQQQQQQQQRNTHVTSVRQDQVGARQSAPIVFYSSSSSSSSSATSPASSPSAPCSSSAPQSLQSSPRSSSSSSTAASIAQATKLANQPSAVNIASFSAPCPSTLAAQQQQQQQQQSLLSSDIANRSADDNVTIALGANYTTHAKIVPAHVSLTSDASQCDSDQLRRHIIVDHAQQQHTLQSHDDAQSLSEQLEASERAIRSLIEQQPPRCMKNHTTPDEIYDELVANCCHAQLNTSSMPEIAATHEQINDKSFTAAPIQQHDIETLQNEHSFSYAHSSYPSKTDADTDAVDFVPHTDDGIDELLFSEFIDLQDVPMNVDETEWLRKFLPPVSMN